MEGISARLDAVVGSSYNSGPVSETSIVSAETELGLLFPPSYRLFLRKYGASFGEGFEIYGLPPAAAPDRPPQWSDVVKNTVMLRPNRLPQNSVAISHDGCDHGYFLECSQTDPQFEGVVIEWGPDHDGGQVIADSFMEFMEKYLGR